MTALQRFRFVTKGEDFFFFFSCNENNAYLVLLLFSQDVGQWKHDGVVVWEESQSFSSNQLRLAQVAWGKGRKFSVAGKEN